MDNSDIIKRIEIRLKELGITKGEFYAGAGITSASYSQWNTGECKPSKKKLQAVADYLGTTTEYLLTGEMDEKNKQNFSSKISSIRYTLKYGSLRPVEGKVIDRINAILKEQGMTGADLSRKIGVSTAVYSQWNTKKTKPSNKNIAKVAAVLGVSVSELTGEAEKEKPTSASEDGLSKDETKLLTLFRQVPEESQQMVTGMIEAALKNLGLLE